MTRMHFAALIGMMVGAYQTAAAETIRTFVSVEPQKFLVQSIGGEHVEVTALVGAGQDPHHFSLTPKLALSLGKAQVFFATGMPFEAAQLERLDESGSSVAVVDLTAGIELQEQCVECDHGEGEDAEGDDHDHEHHHHGHELDTHIWLSPELLIIQAGHVLGALENLAANDGQKADFKENHDRLVAELKAVHTEIKAQLAPFEGQTFYVFHPAFGYFASAYGLVQKAIEEGGKQPTPKSVIALITQAREEGVRTIFVQPGFSQTQAKKVADSIGGEVAELDPLAPDVVANMRRIAATMVKGFAH